jgi:hypothetical protein
MNHLILLAAGAMLSCSSCASSQQPTVAPDVIVVPEEAPAPGQRPAAKAGLSQAERRELDKKIELLQQKLFPSTNYARPGEIDVGH